MLSYVTIAKEKVKHNISTYFLLLTNIKNSFLHVSLPTYFVNLGEFPIFQEISREINALDLTENENIT